MRITWDENKNVINQRKHKVSFEVAAQVFDDPFHLSLLDRIENGEERWQTIGMVGDVVVLLVAHSYTEENGVEVVRIISARKATKKERLKYEENQ
ncbi:MAG TPA: BrnT family toxin [Geobacteraceae bacterium]|nr:BrnT family toxin [Geobacteraceae bacterium]